MPPTLANGSPLPIGDILNLDMWHLYSAVGPQGAWSISATREAKFNLHDETGRTARTFLPDHLPKELDSGKMIAPVFQAGSTPDRLFGFAPEGEEMFLFNLQMGTLAERDAAAQAQGEMEAVMRRVKGIANDRRSYKSYGNKDVLARMKQDLAAVPAKELQAFIDRCSKLPGELRAKRKRDSRWFGKQVEAIRVAMLDQVKPAADRAASLSIETTVSLPAMIHHAIADQRLQKAYVGLWDNTIRCYDLQSGSELWSTNVIGGCKLALGGGALYAGGSRGDVYRIDLNNGSVVWRTNITAATNKLD